MNEIPQQSSTRAAGAGSSAARLLRRALRGVNRRNLRNNEVWLIFACAPLGAAVGLIVALMHMAVSALQTLGFGGQLSELLESGGIGIVPWHLIAVPVLGGLLVGLLALAVRRVRPGDIVDPVEANAIYGGRMSLIDSMRVAVATIVSNGAGASVGMEAAYVQMGCRPSVRLRPVAASAPRRSARIRGGRKRRRDRGRLQRSLGRRLLRL